MHHQSTLSWPTMRNYIAILACGTFGLLASFVLTAEKIHLLQNPMEAPSCSINPIITCASAMNSDQSALFGIPVSMFGIIAYAALLTVGTLLITGSTLHRFIWILMLGMATLGLTSMHYLLLQSIFVLHVICPWCFGIWLTTPVIFAIILRLFAQNNNAPRIIQTASNHIWRITYGWYIILFLTILYVFWDAWEMMFSL